MISTAPVPSLIGKRALLGLLLVLAQPAAAQRPTLEESFQQKISAERIGEYIKVLTAHPTFPGSAHTKEYAEWIRARLSEWGWDARIETWTVLFPRPVERVVELLGPKPFKARLFEPPVPGDPYSEQSAEHLPTYFIYGPDGDVTAPLVYANYGLREDYETLARAGVSVKGAIVIARSGRMWRGGKVELAAEHGAAAMLIYSDPAEDGYARGLPYPDGSWRTPDGVQRGSILNGKYPGDPLTPSVAATPGAKRLPIDSPDNTIARLPAMPLSYADATPLLAALGGETAPESWRGALPLTYRMGPSEARVHLKIKYDWSNTELYDVVGTIRGSTWPDEWIVRGNHHDGWVYGAQDPHSAHSAMLEEARALGELVRAGWAPKRTLVYASWDAEEQGTIGSTEWMEAHLADLNTKAVAYLNTDVIGPGTVRVTGASSLAQFITDIAQRITDPRSGVSVVDRARIKTEANAPTGGGPAGAAVFGVGVEYDIARSRLRFGPPGYGSDHHAFVSHAGIAALNLEFGDDLSLGAYHTVYDDFAWYERFGDPGFAYGRVTAQLNGAAVIGLADATILPVEFSAASDAVAEEIAKLKALYGRLRSAVANQNRLAALDAYRVLASPDHPRRPPDIAPIPVVDLAPLDAAAVKIRAAAERYGKAKEQSLTRTVAPARARAVNRLLVAVDRAALREGGLPGRPYYRNELFSPGRLWDTVPIPAVGDAMLDGDWKAAAAQVPLAAGTLLNIAAAIDAASAALEDVGR
ncbi:MAG: M28 family peptidase [Gemmatimonadota bacterium]